MSIVTGVSHFEHCLISDLQAAAEKRKASIPLHCLPTAPSVDDDVLPLLDSIHT